MNEEIRKKLVSVADKVPGASLQELVQHTKEICASLPLINEQVDNAQIQQAIGLIATAIDQVQSAAMNLIAARETLYRVATTVPPTSS